MYNHTLLRQNTTINSHLELHSQESLWKWKRVSFVKLLRGWRRPLSQAISVMSQEEGSSCDPTTTAENGTFSHLQLQSNLESTEIFECVEKLILYSNIPFHAFWQWKSFFLFHWAQEITIDFLNVMHDEKWIALVILNWTENYWKGVHFKWHSDRLHTEKDLKSWTFLMETF